MTSPFSSLLPPTSNQWEEHNWKKNHRKSFMWNWSGNWTITHLPSHIYYRLLSALRFIASGMYFEPHSEVLLVRYNTSADSDSQAWPTVGSVLFCPLALNHLCLAGMCLSTVSWPTPDLNINIQAGRSTAKVTLRHPKQHILNQVALGINCGRVEGFMIWKRWDAVTASDWLSSWGEGSTRAGALDDL